MTPIEAILYIENTEPNYEDLKLVNAWQLLINTRLCWQLQGWYRRTAEWLIDEGICNLNNNQTQEKKDPEYCDACECSPCDCGYGSY